VWQEKAARPQQIGQQRRFPVDFRDSYGSLTPLTALSQTRSAATVYH
jgi:hypothetical protein